MTPSTLSGVTLSDVTLSGVTLSGKGRIAFTPRASLPYGGTMTIELRNSDRLPAPAGFSHASIASAGRVVHFAGQIGTDAEGRHPDGLAAQTEQALDNLVDAIEGVEVSVDDVAKLTMYVVGWRESMQRDLFTGIAASAQRTALQLVPITLVGVQSLFLDESLIEIEAVAVVDD